jgi:hypothetical protein
VKKIPTQTFRELWRYWTSNYKYEQIKRNDFRNWSLGRFAGWKIVLTSLNI